MPPLSYHSSTQGSTHRSSYHSSTQGSTRHSGRHILPPKGIDVLVDTPYSVGSALIPFVEFSWDPKPDDARRMLDKMLEEWVVDVILWNSIVVTYVQSGDSRTGLTLFVRMMGMCEFGLKSNVFNLVNILPACASAGVWLRGKQVNCFMVRTGLVEDVFMGNAIVHIYAKCGLMDGANKVFGSAAIAVYAQRGHGYEALDVFREMKLYGSKPNVVNLESFFLGCTFVGALGQGKKTHCYAVKPLRLGKEIQAYVVRNRYVSVMLFLSNCLIDMFAKFRDVNAAQVVFNNMNITNDVKLSRSGRLNEAMNLIKEIPMEPTLMVWLALLSTCRTHTNVKLGEYASSRLLELESENDGSYTLFSNIYANVKRWKDVARIWSLMKHSGIKKRPGYSWIYDLLANLIHRINAMGYVPETIYALHDVDDEEKGDILFEHSEKLALADGILTSAPGLPIRITKNLRVSGDCHTSITYISKTVEHEIILSDSSRFHHFNNWSCSCSGYR
ncbi:hypothetical protein LguiA_018321 [Lonicera macranthoides]